MSDIVLVLGQVAFRDFEIPECIRFGGIQRLAVHELPGGQRVIDALGRCDAEISWSGTFGGENATLRARLLDLLRVQGQVLALIWDVFFYSVVISAFEAEYRKGWWIPYRISCTVLRDDAAVIPSASASPVMQLVSDISAATGLAANAGVDLAAAQNALGVANAMIPGTSAYVAAQAALNQASTQISQDMAVADLQLETLATNQLTSTSSASVGAAAITGAIGALGQLSYLSAAGGYIGRSLANLGVAQS
jgi:hypothetical protein